MTIFESQNSIVDKLTPKLSDVWQMCSLFSTTTKKAKDQFKEGVVKWTTGSLLCIFFYQNLPLFHFKKNPCTEFANFSTFSGSCIFFVKFSHTVHLAWSQKSKCLKFPKYLVSNLVFVVRQSNGFLSMCVIGWLGGHTNCCVEPKTIWYVA